jgi:hypothetical protein
MRGIIPAVFTLRGTYVEPDWRYILPPRNVLLAYCTGMRLCASMNSTITTRVAAPRIANTMVPMGLSWKASPIRPADSARDATIPPNMMMEMPLPMPRSVISSPIHTRKMVPAVIDKMMVAVVRPSGRAMTFWLVSNAS